MAKADGGHVSAAQLHGVVDAHACGAEGSGAAQRRRGEEKWRRGMAGEEMSEEQRESEMSTVGVKVPTTAGLNIQMSPAQTTTTSAA